MLRTLWSEVRGWVIVIGVALLVFAYIFSRGERSGRQQAEETIRKAQEKLQEKYNEIDDRPRSYERALDSLYERASRR